MADLHEVWTLEPSACFLVQRLWCLVLSLRKGLKMKPFKFARTRHVYDSYQDFWAMVAIAGLPTCYVDEIDPDADCVYVTTPLTGELKSMNLSKTRTCRIVWWNLERPDGEYAPGYNDVVSDSLLKHVDEIWVSDGHYAAQDSRTKLVVMGSRKELVIPASPSRPHGDVAFYSYVNGRRNHIVGQLNQMQVTLLPNAWAAERSAGLQAAKFYLNVHQTDALIGEPLRFAVAAAYKTMLVSETLANPYPLVPGEDYYEYPYADIARACRLLLDQGGRVERLGLNLYNKLCVEWEFPRDAMRALAEVPRWLEI